MSPPRVDLRSDTVTRATDGMRAAMAKAEVGDDVLDGDPTTRALEERAARLLGKEAALFFPSGTQANQAALLVHSRPGTEAVCDARAHVLHYELAGAAMWSGVQLRPVEAEDGLPGVEAYAAALRGGDRYHPATSLLWLENTHNLAGGVVVPVERLRSVRELGRARRVSVHLDGARLWNAAAASGATPEAYAACADTVMVSLCKGLGAPAGALLAGSRREMERAWTARKRLGGGMRQSGHLAAACLYALDHHLERLSEDHRRARKLAAGCRRIRGLDAREPESNIVMIRVERAPPGHGPGHGEGDDGEDGEGPGAAVARALGERGVGILATGPDRLRAVTHMDVDDAGVGRAVTALREVMAA